MDPQEDQSLKERWERSDLWPTVAEQATSIAGPGERWTHFWNFCPEVSYERFGLFASHLDRYADDVDIGIAHRWLDKKGVPASDWRWTWSNVSPQHYTECPVYSLLVAQGGAREQGSQLHSEMPSDDILLLKPNLYGVGLDLNALWKRLTKWWHQRCQRAS
jgi:hypothetical protein